MATSRESRSVHPGYLNVSVLTTNSNSKQFMPWNWNYDGAKDWQNRQKEGRAGLNLGQSDHN